MWIVGMILWILFSVVAGTVAKNKGRSFAGPVVIPSAGVDALRAFLYQ